MYRVPSLSLCLSYFLHFRPEGSRKENDRWWFGLRRHKTYPLWTDTRKLLSVPFHLRSWKQRSIRRINYMSSSAAITLGMSQDFSMFHCLFTNTKLVLFLSSPSPFISLVQLLTRSVTQINGILLVTFLWEQAKPNYTWKTFFFRRAFMFTPHGSAQREGCATALRLLDNSAVHTSTAVSSIYKCSSGCIFASFPGTSLYVRSTYDILSSPAIFLFTITRWLI